MKRSQNNNAFTLIELLVVIAIIALLMAVLNASVRKVKIVSKNLRQKAAFHAGEVSLELYSKDFGDYPDSSLVADGGTAVTGAQRLAEAFFGRDDQGFHPRSKWHPGKESTVLYDDTTLKDRKTPYFERKRVGFYTLGQLWDTSLSATVESTPVFTDVFARNKVVVNGENEKVGMPILYFKADPTKGFRIDSSTGLPLDPVANGDFDEYSKWVYNFDDNLPILQLPWLREIQDTPPPDGLTKHYQDTDGTDEHAQVFYETITQRKDGNFYKPHNQNGFLLISAGYDGIYGTKDDLTNFDD